MMVTQKTTSNNAENIHNRFRHYGAQALAYRNKCIGMLPRIFKEKIYEQKGFDSIFEYAAKFAGLSREQVTRALGLHAHFADKPKLAAVLESGEVSINKLARIASIATEKNQEFLADQARLLSKSALETLARDVKRADAKNFQNTNGLFEPKTDDNLVPGHKVSPPIRQPESSLETSSQSSATSSLELSPEVQEKLLKLKNKGLDVNAILLELLEKREQEIEEEKERIVSEQTEQTEQTRQKTQANENVNAPQKPSRYIPVKIRRILQKEHGAKCSIEHCNKQSQHIHHTQRFALVAANANTYATRATHTLHNPRYLAPLCREHHMIAHSIDVTLQEVRRGNGM